MNSLKNNLLSNKSIIYIFSDNFKSTKDKIKVEKVRKILKQLDGFKKKKIILIKTNYGLEKKIVKLHYIKINLKI